MKTLTVQEASKSLGDWLRRAISGEQIAINQGECTVLLQPISPSDDSSGSNQPSPREALRQLQSGSHLTAAQAGDYLRDVRAERLTDGGLSGQ